VASRSAGCPGSPYERRLDHSVYDEGALCPVDLRVQLQAPGLDGSRVRGQLSAPGEPNFTLDFAAGTLQSGVATLEFVDGVMVGALPQSLFVFVDVDEDGNCDTSELSWTRSIASSVATQRVDVTLDAQQAVSCELAP
jgi:hypothetical protein